MNPSSTDISTSSSDPSGIDGTATAPQGRRKLVHVLELDGVRGIAAIAVFFHHLCFTSIPVDGWGRGIHLLSYLSKYGAFGVDLFFVLSGFLITSLLIEDRGSKRFYHDFYWKRALRILPLYVLCLLGVLVFYPHSGTYVLLSALFVANFAWIFHVPSSGPFWTLAIEEQFYLLWPTIVRRRSIERISHWAAIIGIGAVVLRLLAACFGHHNYYFTFFHCDGLAMGAWLGCRFEQWGRQGFQSKREKAGWVAALTTAVVLGLASLMLRGGPVADAFSAACEQTAVTLFAGSWIALLLVHRGRPYLAVFRSKPLIFFGLISYAFYMTHLYVMYTYDHLRGQLPQGDLAGYAMRFVAVLGITVALCLVSRYVVELPASSLRRYVLKPDRPSSSS